MGVFLTATDMITVTPADRHTAMELTTDAMEDRQEGRCSSSILDAGVVQAGDECMMVVSRPPSQTGVDAPSGPDEGEEELQLIQRDGGGEIFTDILQCPVVKCCFTSAASHHL
jgi:hypothetical protein